MSESKNMGGEKHFLVTEMKSDLEELDSEKF